VGKTKRAVAAAAVAGAAELIGEVSVEVGWAGLSFEPVVKGALDHDVLWAQPTHSSKKKTAKPCCFSSALEKIALITHDDDALLHCSIKSSLFSSRKRKGKWM